jgi:hypothetical protein
VRVFPYGGMDDVLDDLVRSARRCERAAQQMEDVDLIDIRQRLVIAIEQVERAWSGSWMGYQSRVYTATLQPCRPGERFDTEWGASDSGLSDTLGEWAERDHRAVMDHVSRVAGVSEDDWKRIEFAATEEARPSTQ